MLSSQSQAPGGVNKAVDIALCFLTTSRSYTNTHNPNGQTVGTVAYDTTYTGTPVAIEEQMLSDGYPPYSLNNDPQDPYWPGTVDDITTDVSSAQSLSQVGVWLYACAGNPTYDTTIYQRPNFPNTLNGWI